MTLTYGQLTQASFLQKNQMLQNCFLIFVTLRWHSGVENREIYVKKRSNLSKKKFDIFNTEIAQCRQKLDIILGTKVVQF